MSPKSQGVYLYTWCKQFQEQLLTQLQNLENKWQTQKVALEEDLKFLHERESEIQLKTSELAKIMNELKLYKNVPPEKYFCLYNGVIIKNRIIFL